MSVVPKIRPDDHDEMIQLFLREAQHYVQIAGVLHVGAHRGQEVPHYRAAGIERMVLIEANPEHCKFLTTQYAGNASITVLNCAVTETDGTIDLHINKSRTGNDESSSVLALKELSAIVPTLQTVETITVAACRLDTLLDRRSLNGCNFLNIDIQGAELQALRGAQQTLRQMDAVLIETNLIEMYAGCALQDDVDGVLETNGFTCVERVYHELYQGERRFPAWGESLYVRRSLREAS